MTLNALRPHGRETLSSVLPSNQRKKKKKIQTAATGFFKALSWYILNLYIIYTSSFEPHHDSGSL